MEELSTVVDGLWTERGHEKCARLLQFDGGRRENEDVTVAVQHLRSRSHCSARALRGAGGGAGAAPSVGRPVW